ncbi:MAG: isopentenyl-diphosphate Delta-isomerase [Bacillota bacterium]|nr:isopentenyl-diphosphate Delta-isomerase [Bacillota bacterium]
MVYEHITLVDENDHIIGYGEKYEVHRRALLHRAFSVFVYDESSQKFLIQKRAEGKYHSGGVWSNACCSHPRMNETMEKALNRCTLEELGVEFPEFLPCGSFTYLARFGYLSEHEIDHVFLVKLQDGTNMKFPFNPKEISFLQWMSKEEIEQYRNTNPSAFSAWFFKAYNLVLKRMEDQ